ncbi:MAG TPA: hypothetical protein VGP16_07400, partial [Asanoa sp.]|nr:hypothetical protein [Asanoa sp.]
AITGASLDDIAAYKKDELSRAAEIVGISKVITLGLDDRYAALREDVVDQIAEQLAIERPDVLICDYPVNPVAATNVHTVATVSVLAALGRAGMFVRNLDDRAEFHVKQVFFTSLPVMAGDGLSLYGMRNDVYVDITDVVGQKVAAMDCFDSQGYSGLFARKLIEASNGENGRVAGVNFAEAFYRLNNETHTLLPVTEAARRDDPLTRHISYSRVDLRATYPI